MVFDPLPDSINLIEEVGYDRHRHGVYLVGTWPKRAAFSDEFLLAVDPKWVQLSQGRVTITLRNASAIYAVEYVPLANLWAGRLVEGTFA